MKKPETLSIALGLVGLILGTFMGWRYFVTYPDPSQGIIYIWAAVTIIIFAYFHNRDKQHQYNIEHIENKLDDIEFSKKGDNDGEGIV